ncbi:isocitrate lyase/phosphoenolpyruvate mutase family protein [Dactylosporangium sp. NPDC049525]|uniref:isocitrate lyase/PEP mutase family protein n=1 Tax=Dactylosporangium sp. NPDC049525 TaxID=3154730 RepID=UPI003422AD9B
MNGFRSLHRAGDPLVLPNAWDVASARMLAGAGFPAIGTTSLGVAAANGLPDGEGATDADALRLVERLAGLPCHVSVDIERGSVGVAVAVAAAGAAGINVEDAMGPVEHQVRLIRAVKREVPGLFVNARTDTHWQRAGELGETLRRVRAYADAGADGVFVPGLREPADIDAVVRAVDLPLNVLHDPCGPTVAELTALGVRRVSTGSLLFRVALAAAVDAARAVRDGSPVRTAGLPSYAEIATAGP